MKKITTLIRAGMLSSVLAALLSGTVTSQAAVIAAMGADGTVYTADTANFAGTKTTLATLPTGGNTYLDMTYGNGLVYGLRSDGAVYSSNLSGTTALVSTTGWTSAIAKIDFANGTLFGLKNKDTVIDASGTQHLYITNYGGYIDFGVRDNGNISVIQQAPNAFVYTYTDGYVGTQDPGYVQFTNFQFGNSNPLALDVNGQFQAALYTNTNTSLNESGYQNAAAAPVFMNNNTQSTELALSDDNSSVFYLGSDFAVRTGPLANSALTGVGDFSTATDAVGIVVIPEPSTWVLLAVGLTTVVVLRRRGSNVVC